MKERKKERMDEKIIKRIKKILYLYLGLLTRKATATKEKYIQI